MPTPMEQRIPHESMDQSGKIPVLDGGKILVETTGPWFVFVGETKYRFDPPDRVKVTEKTAASLEKGNAAIVLGKGKKATKKEPVPQNKALKPSEDKAGDGDGEELFDEE